MKVRLLDTLAMVTLRVGQAKESLLQKRTISCQLSVRRNRENGGEGGANSVDALLLVPKRKGDVLLTMGVSDSGNAVFTPSICSGARMVVGEIWREWTVLVLLPTPDLNRTP